MTDDTPPPSLLDERLEIETPERVTIVYDLAGIGSRFAAGTVDVVLLTFAFLVLTAVVVIAGSIRPRGETEAMAFAYAVAGSYVALLSAYYLGFEWLWAGQTPGKRWLKLRVLSDGGGPASPGAIVIRNILRVADLLPFVAPYGLAGVVMFVNRRAKRIGDFAAGTIVVRERTEVWAPPVISGEDLAGDALDAAELARIRSFVSRAPQMIPGSRAALARKLADGAASRHGLTFVDAEGLLRALASGRSPRELREAQGPRE